MEKVPASNRSSARGTVYTSSAAATAVNPMVCAAGIYNQSPAHGAVDHDSSTLFSSISGHQRQRTTNFQGRRADRHTKD